MPLKLPPRTVTGDRDTDLGFERHRISLGEIIKVPILDGSLIREVLLEPEHDNRVPHGLGRPYQAVFISPARLPTGAAGSLCELPSDAPTKWVIIHSRYLTQVRVNLWVI